MKRRKQRKAMRTIDAARHPFERFVAERSVPGKEISAARLAFVSSRGNIG